jgi:hypothetical protein
MLRREVDGAYCGDLLSWVMGRAEPDNAWVTIMPNVNVAAVASLTDVSCVILAENVKPDDNLFERAQKEGLPLLASPLSAYELCRRIGNALS